MTVSGQVITVPMACQNNQSFTLTYGVTGTGASAQTTAGTAEFTTQTTESGQSIANISSQPVVTVNAGTANKLVFTTQPVGGVAEGTNFTTSPVVSVEDANGNVVTTDTGSVTLAINSGPGAGSLTCSNTGFPTISAVAGVATFTNCQITGTAAAGTYTLAATRTGLTPTGASSNVVINVGSASQLVFTTQPVGGVTEGTNFATSPVVKVEDASGNVVTTDTRQRDPGHQLRTGRRVADVLQHWVPDHLRGGRCGHLHQLPDHRHRGGRHLHAEGHPHGNHPDGCLLQRRDQRWHGQQARLHHPARRWRG